ncbi:MAG: SIS domain-containing protein [Saprospiraceae bacterium]|nr:SIS domain-containing protein [Saprospiraceae bacterium]
MGTSFKKIIKEHQGCINDLLSQPQLEDDMNQIISAIVNCFKNKGKVLFCGNGGSAADAEHLAGELSGRFKIERSPLDAEALHVNSAALTAISNDYGYDNSFARILEAKGNEGDVLIAMSTSGSSKNILNALQKALSLNMTCVALVGQETQHVTSMSKFIISIPSDNTPRIQEAHMLLGHIICEEVEKQLFQSE